MLVCGCNHVFVLAVALHLVFLIDGYTSLQVIQNQGCQNFTNGVSEYLRTPGYPHNYLHNLDCRRIIKAGSRFHVTLKFQIFHLEASEGCRYDYLEIRDGMYGFSPLLFKGCGDDIRHGETFESTSQSLWIRFQSDSQITRKGFLATVSAQPHIGESKFDCHFTIKDSTDFKLGDKSLPTELYNYYRKHPNQEINCVWDIHMPHGSKVFMRITNYTTTHLTSDCDLNHLEGYESSTASTDLRWSHCSKPMTPWVSDTSHVVVRLNALSIYSIPQFKVIGNVYMNDASINCSGEDTFSCHDGHCIPLYLRCDHQENCAESYDEDCSAEINENKFRSKYITLFVVVIVGSVLLTTLMTISEVVQRRKEARKERNKQIEQPGSSNQSTKSSTKMSVKASLKLSGDQCMETCSRGQCSTTTADSIIETFRSSRLNENVSFRKAKTPHSVECKVDLGERIYQTPHIALPPHKPRSSSDELPPTPPPPPAPMEEGRGFRLIYDLTNLGKSAAASTFEYPPPPPFLKENSDDEWTTEDYTSTSSSSYASLPKDNSYDVACMDRRRGEPLLKTAAHSMVPQSTESSHKAKHHRERDRLKPPVQKKKPVVTTKRSWTFDDDTDDGAMELTTYISTC